MNEIKFKYRFILINNEDLNNYFNNLDKKIRKSEGNNNIILKNDQKKEIYLDKELINYICAMIELKLEEKIKSDVNKNRISANEDNNNINSISDCTQNEDKIKLNNDNTEKKEESKNSIMINEKDKNYEQILDEFQIIDTMILDCYETVNNFNQNRDLVNLIKIYNEYYIMNRKKILYDKIKKLILDLEKKDRKKKSEVKFNINETNQNSIKPKKVVFSEDDNDYLRQLYENLKEKNDYLQKENAELKENLSKNINEIASNNSKIILNKLTLPKNAIGNQNINLYSARNQKYFKNKTAGNEVNLLNNILNKTTKKSILNNTNLNNNTSSIFESDQTISNINSNNNNNTSRNILQFNKTNTNSFLDLDEMANSHSEMFSIIGNNTSINDKFLFETTVLENNQKNDNLGTPTLSPRSNILDGKDESSNSYINILSSNSKITDINGDSANYGKIINLTNKKEIIPKNNDKEEKEKKSLFKVTNLKDNKFSFAAPNLNSVNNLNNLDLKIKSDKKNYYDFKYLSQNKKVHKILFHNNEKVKPNEMFSDQINFIFNGNKKKKGILLITSENFYLFDDSEDINCEFSTNHQLLSSISISKENFNYLLFSFTNDNYIIIEIYNRIQLLSFIKEIYLYYKYKKIDIYNCDSFNIKLKNNHSFSYDLKNNKDISLTGNFENAIKIGFLYKHKENLFTGYFSEKLVVLCSIGLVVFSKSNISLPKFIIPIIGSNIKSLKVKLDEKLFCFAIKTFNNETYIFGSFKNKEYNDWIQEIKNYQKAYELKMNDIMSNFVIHSNKESN